MLIISKQRNLIIISNLLKRISLKQSPWEHFSSRTLRQSLHAKKKRKNLLTPLISIRRDKDPSNGVEKTNESTGEEEKRGRREERGPTIINDYRRYSGQELERSSSSSLKPHLSGVNRVTRCAARLFRSGQFEILNGGLLITRNYKLRYSYLGTRFTHVYTGKEKRKYLGRVQP